MTASCHRRGGWVGLAQTVEVVPGDQQGVHAG
eukprot:CAMPEP_0198122422 /NCGR_PEP_ID=MMETSP1442-20131203/34803_1 /TAXON_ID= /ORGANISM="Craspedostauros australis, Strain CCMP3328" /LENGTH=31 /DNA_ID= /DNA_START= /DNA_END= /DNA_ORIENTATION=